MTETTLQRFREAKSSAVLFAQLRNTEIEERVEFEGESREVAAATIDKQLHAAGIKAIPAPKKPNSKATVKGRPGPQVVKPTITSMTLPGFVNAAGLLAALWPQAESRPTKAWLRSQAKSGRVPSVRIGGSVFFQVSKVRATLLGEMPPGSITEKDAAKLSNAELWAICERIESQEEKRQFYEKHIKNRPGIS